MDLQINLTLDSLPPQEKLLRYVTTLPTAMGQYNYKTYCTLGDSILRAAVITRLHNSERQKFSHKISRFVSNENLSRVFAIVKPTIYGKRGNVDLSKHAQGDIIESMLVYYAYYDSVGFNALLALIMMTG